MKKLLLILIVFYFVKSNGQERYYSDPVKMPLFLSASFGELRSNHFHSGIDIKTQGTTGIPVNSVADGFISRIVISSAGFGKAIYIDHPNGTTTVYGHLDHFRKDIDNYVKDYQYKKESFRIDFQLPENKFPVLQNEIIAYSGNSGSSGGPHLHFEIRDTKSEEPLNPLSFNFPVADNIAPKIYSLLVVPLNETAQVNNSIYKKSFPVVFYDGKFHLNDNPVIPVFNEVGFAIQTNDFLNGANNPCGIYSMQLKIDGELYFTSLMDRFSFNNSRAINSYIDYSEFIRSGRRFQKTWIDPGNPLNIYHYSRNRGIYNFNDGNIHHISIILKDTYGNTSSLDFNVKSHSTKVVRPEEKYLDYFSYDKQNNFEENDFHLLLPEGSLYTDLKFNYRSKPGGTKFYSDIHVIDSDRIPLNKNAEIEIKSKNLPEILQSKVVLAIVDTLSGRFVAAGGEFENGWVKSSIRTFGNYAVTVDTIPPRIISLSIGSNASLTESERIRFRISDDLAGIDKIEGYIDDKWILFDYDAKNNLITHYFDEERFELKKRHEFLLRVTDYRGNITTYENTFWK